MLSSSYIIYTTNSMVRKKTLFRHLYYIFVENPEFKINQHIILWYQINGLSILHYNTYIIPMQFFCIANRQQFSTFFFYTASNTSKTKLFFRKVAWLYFFWCAKRFKIFFSYFIILICILLLLLKKVIW